MPGVQLNQGIGNALLFVRGEENVWYTEAANQLSVEAKTLPVLLAEDFSLGETPFAAVPNFSPPSNDIHIYETPARLFS